MIKTTIQKVGFFLFYRQYEIGDLILGTMGVLWGLWILNPFWDTFSLPSYIAFLNLFPEWVWGISVLTLGIITIIAALCKHRYYFRATTLLVNVVVWSFIASKFLLSEPSNTGFPVYAMVALTSIWLYLRLTIFTKLVEFSVKDLREFRRKSRRH